MELTEESLRRFVGGQLDIQNPDFDYHFRGEIRSVSLKGELLIFHFSREATLNDGEWEESSEIHWVCYLREGWYISGAEEGRIVLEQTKTNVRAVLFLPEDGDIIELARHLAA